MSPPGTGFRLVALALAWLGAAAAQLQQPSLWPAAAYSTATACGLACAVAALLVTLRLRSRVPDDGERLDRARGAQARAERRASAAAFMLALCAAAMLSFGQAGWRAGVRLADRLDPSLEGTDLVVTGVIASLPVISLDGQRFRFDIEDARHAGAAAVRVPRHATIGWYRDAEAPAAALRAGERWRFTVRLRQPHGSVNPHGFDYELCLFEQGIRASGHVRAARAAQRLGDGAGYRIERLRQRIRDAIFERVSDRRAAGVLAALVVGDQAAIERDDWDIFRATGVAHLMSISGVHVTMFAWLAGALAGWGWRRSETLMLRVPAAVAARWCGLALATAYALLAGWGVPAQRTVLMLATVTLLRSAGVRWPWPPVLLAAAVVVAAFDPWALLQPGFWLSFAAVGLLMGSLPAQPPEVEAATRRPRRRLLDAARAAVRTQVVATLGLAPLTLVFFQQLSLVGFVANLIAIPLVTLLVTPLALAGALSAPLWHAAALGVDALVGALEALAALPGALWHVAAAPWWAQAAGLAAGALALMPLPWHVRSLALPLALPLLVPPPDRPAPGRFDLIAADVGQGTAIVVRTHSRLLLYDAGPQYSRDTDAGERVLLPLLRALGASTLDMLVLSHRDIDHTGGAPTLLEGLRVGTLLHSLEPGHPLLGAAVPLRRCEAGLSWQWDGVRFDVLHPRAEDHAGALKPNALSCVLRVGAAQGTALLSGDIEAEQERALVQREGERLHADVLAVPHHGSRTSSTPAFLDAVRPRVALVQAGYRNRFGHPAPAVVERYRERGITLVRSDTCGAWTWSARAASMTCLRSSARRYWRPRPAGGPGEPD